MSKIKLTGSNSGYVEIDSAADAGNLTLTLPTSGVRLLSNTDNVFSGITTTGELDINGKIDVSTDAVIARNLSVGGITTHTGTTTLSDDVTFTGASYNVLWDKSDNQLEFADNAKISFGGSSDLQIYHDGNRSIISDTGTGELRMNGSAIQLRDTAQNFMINATANDSVDLYFNQNKKFETTNTGAIVTGICTATSFSGSGENLTRTTQLSHRNIIINGAMIVSQRGTTSTSSGLNTLDRWTMNWNGGGVTQAKISEQSGTVFENGFSNYLRMTNTGNTTTDTDYRFIGNTIEAQYMANSGWNFKSSSSYVTLSAWVRSSLAGTYYGWLNSRDGTNKTYTFSYTLSANTWTKVTKTIPGNSGIDIHNNTEEGLIVHFIPWYGTYYTTSGHTLDAWQTSSSTNRCPDYSQNWANTSNATFDVTGVQLEVGEQATPFEHRSFGEELARCQRYFYMCADGTRGKSGTNRAPICTGAMYNAVNFNGVVNFPVEMRTTPSLYKVVGSGYFRIWGNGGSDGCNDVVLEGSSPQCGIANIYDGLSQTSGSATWATTDNAACRLGFQAEI